MKLRERFLIFHGLWARDILVVERKESRSMNNGKEGRPFLKEDVDELV